MKLIKKLFTVLAASALLAGSFTGCSNIASNGDIESVETAYGRVAFSVPESVTLTNIILKGAKDGTSKTYGTWADTAAVKAATVEIPVGKYNFELYAEYDGSTMKGECEGEIKANSTTALSFTLKRVNPSTTGNPIQPPSTDDGGQIITKGELQDDGSYLIIDWDGSKYTYIEKAEYDKNNAEVSQKVNGAFGDVTASNCSEKTTSTFLQLSALSSKGDTQGEIKFNVPVNTSKIVVSAKNGSSSKGNPSLTIGSGDWSKIQADIPATQTEYTFVPAFTITTDEEGNTLQKKAISITNTGANGKGSLNIYSIKVYAPTIWEFDTSKGNIGIPSGSAENKELYETTNVTVDLTVTTEATSTGSSVNIKKAEGWLNSAYVIFDGTASSKYTITCDGKAVDNELIRFYTTYNYNTNSYDKGQTTWTPASYNNVWRVDVLGLAAGEHTISITPQGGAATTVKANVINADRSGYGFATGKTPGAYNADGTLKANAKVIYVTKDNAKTVSYELVAGVNCSDKSKAGVYTGLQDILSQSALKAITVPLDIRIIGKLSLADLDRIDSSAEGLQVKENSEAGVTIEGVGHDATIWGFGFLIRNSRYVELNNLGIMCFLDDAISLDTDNQQSWIHNCDVFYGSTGGDSDQAKGDGSLDVKGKSSNQSYSYMHFWDSGKMSLCGMSGETSASRLTYHHNWFDHSDSRHPRIRAQTVHIYNNYFDGNSKYGVGVTLGASAFVEQNAFRNPHDPMMSSKQGTDAQGDGTFSGEAGGVIKAYNNMMFQLGYNGVKFQYITNKDEGWESGNNDIDAYIVDNRTDKVPATVKAVSGGTTYNNFDTSEDLHLAEGSLTEPAVALNNVLKFAGRHNPDFAWTFDNTTADASYALDKELKAAVVAYKNTGLTKIGN